MYFQPETEHGAVGLLSAAQPALISFGAQLWLSDAALCCRPALESGLLWWLFTHSSTFIAQERSGDAILRSHLFLKINVFQASLLSEGHIMTSRAHNDSRKSSGLGRSSGE